MTPFLELPFVTTSSRLSYEIIQELLDKNLINSEFTEAQFLLATMNAPAQMFANKKLAKLEDFKGIRFLCMGPVWNKSMGLLGSQCVTMGMPDAYLGLQRGTLDGAANTVAVSLAFKWPEVVKYPTEVSFMGGYVNVFFMNKKSWSKLSPEVQAEWISISKKYGPKMAAVWDGSEDAAKITWEKLGKRVETFPAAEKEKMAKILEPVWLDWIDRMEKGGKPGKEIYQTYVKFMKKNKQPVVVKLPGLYKD
jgi:TRAP-type C4-dicarboxylate transport system substrate-binding protein